MLNINWQSCLSKAKIYVGSTPYETSGSENIIDGSIVKNMVSSDTDPLGKVSSNKLYLKINDVNNYFKKGNTLSPYYGLLVEGLKIEIYYNVDNTGFTRAGVFFMSDLKTNTNDKRDCIVEFEASDILQYMLNKPININRAMRNVTIYNWLVYIFEQIGLTSSEYSISTSLQNYTIKYAFATGELYKELFTELCNSYMCNMYCDEDGVIQVRDLRTLTTGYTKQMDISSSTNLFSTALGNDILLTYNAIKLNYIVPTLKKDKQVLDITDLNIPANSSVSDTYNFDGNKIVSLDHFDIFRETLHNVNVTSFEATQSTITPTISNIDSVDAKIDLRVYANTILENSASVEVITPGIIEANIKYLTRDTKYIQDKAYADEFLDDLLKYITAEVGYIKITTKGHPLLRLADIVNVTSTLAMVNYDCIVSSVSQSFGSSYACKLTLLCIDALA